MSSVVKVTRLKAKWEGRKVKKVTQIGRDKVYCMSCWSGGVKEQLERDQVESMWVEIEVKDHELYRCTKCGDLVA